MTDAIAQLREMSTPPLDPDAFTVWVQLHDATAFLRDNARQDELVAYAGLTHCFLHVILVPASMVSPPDVDDLMSWNCNASSTWGISRTFNPSSIFISPPLDHTGSKTLNKGEQLVFARHFEGRLGNKSYFEVLQKLVHVSNLHFLAERNAYCRLDGRGDIEEVIRIIEVSDKASKLYGTIVVFRRDLLDEYMTITDSVAIRTFDFTRFRPSGFGGWSNVSNPEHVCDVDISYRFVIEPGHASYMRGFQILRSQTSKEMVAKRFDFGEPPDREYASFTAYDWKNGIVREISTAPGATANYFMKSALPFETSPAFFRPEVLQRYKADSDKYRLGGRSISCRGAWGLKTYDINEAGQVHTYIVYLRDLPYEEQHHWKAYNEEPKAPISRRAFKTDFEGEWDLEYDPLVSLKKAACDLDERAVPWWTLRSEKLLNQVHYPVTTSADEWANELLQLDQLIVEGFEEKWLRAKAKSLGREPEPQHRSLKLVEQCLIGLGFEEDHSLRVSAPFHELHDLRSKLKGHASGEEAVAIKRKILAQHGSYNQQFRALCTACDESLRIVREGLADSK